MVYTAAVRTAVVIKKITDCYMLDNRDYYLVEVEGFIFTSGLYFVLRAVPARPQYSPLTYSPRKIQPASRRHLI